MIRDLEQLADNTHDVLVVGGGIYGACIAWDAVSRGLSVALIEKGDFGHATSANSLKTVHGGLRYLQDADLRLIRMMIRERSAFLRIAPHLVHPLPCMMPTAIHFKRSKLVLGTALILNDLLGFHRNQNHDPQKRLPNGKIITREECLRILPGLPAEEITGAAVWYDGQMYNPERFTLAFILSSAKAGAAVANYIEGLRLILSGNRVIGVKARDMLTGNELDIRARVVVNATGPWVDTFLNGLGSHRNRRMFNHSLAINLVARKFISDYAVGVPTRPLPVAINNRERKIETQTLFVSPWRNVSLVGTFHSRYTGRPEDFEVSQKQLEDFLLAINTAYSSANLSIDDIYAVHYGFLPRANPDISGSMKLVRDGQIYDHRRIDQTEGLITVVGVKFTAARYEAQRVVDLIFNMLGEKAPECKTDRKPLMGGDIERFGDFMEEAIRTRPHNLRTELVKHLVLNYGTEYQGVLDLIEDDPSLNAMISPSENVCKAEVVYSVRFEMAQKLSDVILRRTELGTAGVPEDSVIQKCADIMSLEKGWNQERKQRELEEVKAHYKRITVG